MKKNDMQDEDVVEDVAYTDSGQAGMTHEDEVSEQMHALEAQYKRALADYQNLEKRVSEQRREWIQSANKDLLLRLIPILDTLMMASQHSEEQSLKITIDQFLGMLKQEGVTRIETKGRTFDPNTMEAIGTSEGEDGKVIQEARAGYLLYDKILRPAQVLVGAKEK